MSTTNRIDLEQFVTRWAAAVTEGPPDGSAFVPLLADSIDPAPFVARAAAMRAHLGSVPLRLTVDEMVCEGDRVAWMWTLLAGDRALRGVSFQRIVDGRLVEHATLSAA